MGCIANDKCQQYYKFYKHQQSIESIIKNLDSKIENIVLVYDALEESKHAKVMLDIVKSLIPNQDNDTIKILHIPEQYIKPKKLKNYIDMLQNKHIKVFITISTLPKENIESYSDEMKKFSERGVTITLAVGNTYRLKLEGESNITKVLNIDNEVWTGLNKIIAPVLEKNTREKIPKYLFTNDFKKVLKREIRIILTKKNIKQEELKKKIKTYLETLQTYFFIHYLQSLKHNIILVSAHTPFIDNEVASTGYLDSYKKYQKIKSQIPQIQEPKYDNNFSLDCRIKGLVNYQRTVRNFGQYPNVNNGTSQATPAVLIEKMLKVILVK